MNKIVLKSILIVMFSFIILGIYPDQNEVKYNEMNDESLFNIYKERVLRNGTNFEKPDMKECHDEINRRRRGSHTRKLEYLMLKEIETPKLTGKVIKEYQFQILCSQMIRYVRFDESYNQMISMLKERNIFKHPMWSEDIIKKLSFDKYEKAIPVLSEIAYDKNSSIYKDDVHIAAKNALAVIGKPGVDLIINRFIQWENLPDNDPRKQVIPLLSPLRLSKDKRALELAWRHINSPKLEIRVQALSVLGCLGAKISDEILKLYEEEKITKGGVFEMYVSCPDLDENERERIKNILLDALDNYYEDYIIRLISARNLIYYPYPDVVYALEKSKKDDPYKSFYDETYPIRERAEKSLEYFNKFYPELFEKKK